MTAFGVIEKGSWPRCDEKVKTSDCEVDKTGGGPLQFCPYKYYYKVRLHSPLIVESMDMHSLNLIHTQCKDSYQSDTIP
jgi:hypothetical protein